jgi:chromosomal replication initiator protein
LQEVFVLEASWSEEPARPSALETGAGATPARGARARTEPVAPNSPGDGGSTEPSSEMDGACASGTVAACVDLDARWNEMQDALAKLVQREQFETWFRRAQLRRADASSICLVVQNAFTRDWLAQHYLWALDKAVRAVFGSPLRIEFAVDAELMAAPRPASRDAAVASARRKPGVESGAAAAPSAETEPRRAKVEEPRAPLRSTAEADVDGATRLMWASDIALNPQYRFDNFVVGPCNRFAHAASQGVSESPGKNYNPFFLHGSNGLGKTHLLQSLCYSLLERSNQTRILYLSCETFVNHFIAALEDGNLTKFRHKYRNVDVLVVDDIHLLANKERTQEEFFHTFNTLYNAGKQIVLSSDSSPKEIPSLQERLVSRFKWGLVTEIEPPCYETRMAILKRKSKERGHELPDDVARLIAEHIHTNIRELEGAVTRVLGYAAVNAVPLSTELVYVVLRDVFKSRRGQPTMEEIVRVVTTHFNVKLSELQSKRRSSAIVQPRQIGMYLLRKTTRSSLEEIGAFFGGRDHSTVLYAVEKVELSMQRDARLRELVAGFLEELQRG